MPTRSELAERIRIGVSAGLVRGDECVGLMIGFTPTEWAEIEAALRDSAVPLTDHQRLILDRHLAALRDDALGMDAVADLFCPEFDACWERKADGSMGAMLNGERAQQLRDLVLEGRRNAQYNRELADAIEVAMSAYRDPTSTART